MLPHKQLLVLLLIAVAVCMRVDPQACFAAEDSHSHASTEENDQQLLDQLARDAIQNGDAIRGAKVFLSAKTACLSCHRVNEHGGKVGPDLS